MLAKSHIKKFMETLALIGIALAGSTQAQAAQQRSEPVSQAGERSTGREGPADTIVVTGKGPAEETRVRKLAEAVTRDLGFDKPIARYSDPVCFAVAGLKASQSTEVADRLVADAEQAGLHLSGGHCTPNIFVVFVDDGRNELMNIWKRRPQIFGKRDFQEIKGIIKEPGPARAILSIVVKGADGRPMNGRTLTTGSTSQISLPFRRDIISSVVIIERTSIVGLTPIQIADYAAMRALTNSWPSEISGTNSILGLFNHSANGSPGEMTVFDREYLKSVYSGNGNVRSILKIDQIVRNIMKASIH